jgi:hypothetical protein
MSEPSAAEWEAFVQLAGRRSVALLLGIALAVGGCARVRGVGGGAFSASEHAGHTGLLGGADVLLGFDRIPQIGAPPGTPFGFHVMGEVIAAEQTRDIAWGTGVAYFEPPEPVSGYALVGTSLHVNRVEEKYSFGNLSPYVELGVAAPLDSSASGSDRAIFTFGVGGMVFFNYLLPRDQAVTAYYALKFGFGYDWGAAD